MTAVKQTALVGKTPIVLGERLNRLMEVSANAVHRDETNILTSLVPAILATIPLAVPDQKGLTFWSATAIGFSITYGILFFLSIQREVELQRNYESALESLRKLPLKFDVHAIADAYADTASTQAERELLEAASNKYVHAETSSREKVAYLAPEIMPLIAFLVGMICGTVAHVTGELP